MNLAEMDIVYIVKEANMNEELRYSLRSIAKNIPHRNLVIAGYKPAWVRSDLYIRVTQNKKSKHQNAEGNWVDACKHYKVSNDFMLFNDDFFIMKPITELPIFHRGDYKKTTDFYVKNHPGSKYTANMVRTSAMLVSLGLDDKLLSYELHTPMVLNKTKRLVIHDLVKLLNPTDDDVLMRSIYGNYYHLGGDLLRDVKVYDNDNSFDHDSIFLSTDDNSFKRGKVGEFIREQFSEKCRYEI